MLARNVFFVALVMAPLWLCCDGPGWTQPELILIGAAACLVACFDRALRQHLAERARLRHVLALLLGLSSAWLLLHDSLAARWWLIDDHEIADALTVGRTDTLSGLWNTLASHREVGSPTWSYPRYRPSYYTLRYLETYLWGFKAKRWYLMRIVMLGVSFALSWQALFALLGPSQATLTLLYALTAPFWVDIFCRLGPSEHYALLGCALFVYGASSLLADLHRERPLSLRHWLVAALGSVIASGSKENFVFVPGLLAILLGLAAVRRRLDKKAALVSAAALLCAAWIVLVALISVRRHGATVYGKEAPLGNGPMVALVALKSLWASIYPAVAVAVAIGLALPRRTAARMRRLSTLALGLLLCTSVYVSQIIVYGTDVRSGARYNFPSALIGVLIVSLAFAWLRWEAQRAQLSPLPLRALDCALLAAATVAIATTSFDTLTKGVAANVARTRIFSGALKRAQARAHAEPRRPVLFAAAGSLSIVEPLVSLRIYLDYYGVENPIFLSVPAEADGAAAIMLRSWSVSGLNDWEHEEGLRGGRGAHGKFLPLRELSAWGPPFGVSVGASLPPDVPPLEVDL